MFNRSPGTGIARWNIAVVRPFFLSYVRIASHGLVWHKTLTVSSFCNCFLDGFLFRCRAFLCLHCSPLLSIWGAAGSKISRSNRKIEMQHRSTWCINASGRGWLSAQPRCVHVPSRACNRRAQLDTTTETASERRSLWRRVALGNAQSVTLRLKTGQARRIADQNATRRDGGSAESRPEDTPEKTSTRFGVALKAIFSA